MRVLTVHLLVGQVLFQLDRKSLPEAAEAIDSLRGHGKYFDEMENYRMVQFIKLMQQVLKANFRLHEIANTEKNYEHLVSRPFSFRGKLNELEVIPYEKLWNHVLTKL